ncbi:MAG TPA: YciI family protein [Streptosporangiaceae bacterium]|nr:YciI family protein [Streptosporangiaceae bacterium]
MKYLMLGLITETGQQLRGPDLEAWMAEIVAWYEKQGSAGTLADPGHQLDWPDKAKTVRASGVTDGPYMEAKEVLGGYSLVETATIDEAVELAKTWPGLDRGWITMEVRPVMVM